MIMIDDDEEEEQEEEAREPIYYATKEERSGLSGRRYWILDVILNIGYIRYPSELKCEERHAYPGVVSAHFAHCVCTFVRMLCISCM